MSLRRAPLVPFLLLLLAGAGCVPRFGGGASGASAQGGPIAEIAAGLLHTCVLLRDGRVACWGSNDSGQLGRPLTEHPLGAVKIDGLIRATEISSGIYFTCARTSEKTVDCWGIHGRGQLGAAGELAGEVRFPVAVTGIADALHVSAGSQHACALREGGKVSCWGANVKPAGARGSTLRDSAAPVEVEGLTHAVEVAAGDSHTCARLGDGHVVCWGETVSGAIGDGTREARARPVLVAGLDDAVEITAGSGFSCARRSSGAVACWGSNHDGQLGDGTFDDHETPVAVKGLVDAVSLARGTYHTCARRKTGAVVCWGRNTSGQLGDGSAVSRATPVPVADLADAIEVGLGFRHSCGARADGSMKCWGANDEGQLGRGTKGGIETSPVDVRILGE